MNAMAFRMGAQRGCYAREDVNPWDYLRSRWPNKGMWTALAVLHFWAAKRRQLYHHLTP